MSIAIPRNSATPSDYADGLYLDADKNILSGPDGTEIYRVESRLGRSMIAPIRNTPETEASTGPNSTPIKGVYTRLTDLVFSPGVITPVQFDTVENQLNLRLEADGSTFTVLADGAITLAPQPQVTNTNPFGTIREMEMALEVDAGSGWLQVPNTGVKLSQNSQNSGVLPLIWTHSFAKNHQFRIVAAADDSDMIMDAIDSAFGLPKIPSIIFAVTS